MSTEIQSINNSEDSIEEITEQTWLGRLGGALFGMIFGLVLFFGAFPLLVWNEGRSVADIATVKEGMQDVVSVISPQPDPAYNDKLVHVTGKTATDEMLSDEIFYLSVNAVKLQRIIEMYQWQESQQSVTHDKVGGGSETVTTYNYQKDWSQNSFRSQSFHHPEGHANPPLPYRSNEYAASAVRLDGFSLSTPFIEQLNSYRDYPVTAEIFAKINPELTNFKLHGSEYYSGANPDAPAVGDMRVHFRIVAPGETVSVMGKQNQARIEPFQTKDGIIKLVSNGDVDAATMFRQEQARNAFLTWALRAGGWFIMFLGLSLLLAPLKVLADVVPFFGTMVEMGVGLIAFMVSAVLCLITVAIAWFAYRPVVSIGLLAVASVLVILMTLGKRKPIVAEAIPGPVKYFKVPRPSPHNPVETQ